LRKPEPKRREHECSQLVAQTQEAAGEQVADQGHRKLEGEPEREGTVEQRVAGGERLAELEQREPDRRQQREGRRDDRRAPRL
jgi:hypothetical protein